MNIKATFVLRALDDLGTFNSKFYYEDITDLNKTQAKNEIITHKIS